MVWLLVCNNLSNKKEAIKALNSIFNDKAFGSAGNKVVIEEFLEGEEASFIAVKVKTRLFLWQQAKITKLLVVVM